MGRRCFVWLAFLLLVVWPAVVLGRAGGGGGFHGGGGGGFGGGGRSSGGFGGSGGFHSSHSGGSANDAASTLVLVVIIIVVVIFILAARQAKTSFQERVISDWSERRDAYNHAEAVALIEASDPGFNRDAFVARMRRAFDLIQQAWSAQDLSRVRAFISDGVHERFSLQFEEQKLMGYRNLTVLKAIHRSLIVDAEFDEVFETLTVVFEASVVDYRESLATGQRISGSDGPPRFTEYWSFIRRRGAKTLRDHPGLIEGNCPNCGASIELNQNANCTHCGAVLRSGEHDWVLSEITQESEWSPGRGQAVPGVAALQQRDPGFSRQHIEDLASVIFWRKAMAELKGDVAYLRKMASDELCGRYQAGMSAGGSRAIYADCAVGSVDSLAIGGGEQRDRALVQVTWEGQRFMIAGDRLDQTSHRAIQRTMLVLERQRGLASAPQAGINSAHCPGCGGPQTATTTNACEFCGKVLNDGSTGWVLTDLMPVASQAAQQLLRSLEEHPEPPPLPKPRRGGLLSWVVGVVVADGVVTQEEREMLRQLASRQKISQQAVDAMLASALAGQFESISPVDQAEAQEWLSAMIEAALADGKIVDEEWVMLRRMAGRAGLSESALQELVRGLRATAYRSAWTSLTDTRVTDSHSPGVKSSK
ncbi:MAG: TIM44-like domain-containing protein [Tepidisphaeraceae bacterium]